MLALPGKWYYLSATQAYRAQPATSLYVPNALCKGLCIQQGSAGDFLGIIVSRSLRRSSVKWD